MRRRKKYTARAVRSGRWWSITVPELKGVHSQARRLDQANGMAREAIALFLDVPVRSIDVEVQAVLPATIQAEVERARKARSEAESLQQEATSATARAARDLVTTAKLTLREAGQVLGVSHQRVAQLTTRR